MHCKSFSHFFNKKYWQISDINVGNNNEMLTNKVVSLEQLGPGLFLFCDKNADRQYSTFNIILVLEMNKYYLRITCLIQSSKFFISPILFAELANREIENLQCVETLEDQILDLTDELEARRLRENEQARLHESEKQQIIEDIEGMRVS